MVQKILIICGPTAVGKSKLALELAQKLDAEIVSADSGQVWKGLDIGTAKPTVLERKAVRHHLIDIAAPDGHFDCACFVEQADQAIADISRRGKLPLVVGGTGLYLRILLYGLCEAPPQDKTLRQQLMERAKSEGLPILFEGLKRVDEESSKRLHPNDTTRIVRALEVYELTGYPISHFQKGHRFQKPRYDAVSYGLNCDRQLLYERIEKRVNWMIANGWVEEVRELLKFYPADCQALRSTIGYPKIVAHLRGQISLEEVVPQITKQTKAFAKRQWTWFRTDKKIQWMAISDLDAWRNKVLSKVQSFALDSLAEAKR